MLWNVVYDFFVKYIFGGYIYVNGNLTEFNAFFGSIFYGNNTTTNISTSRVLGYSGFDIYGNSFKMPIGNYFSLIATIISMIVIFVLCCALIKKIYNMCAHIIG